MASRLACATPSSSKRPTLASSTWYARRSLKDTHCLHTDVARISHISPSDICSGQTRLSPEGAAAAHQNLRGSGVTGACGADPDILHAWTELVLKDLRGDAAEQTSAVRLSAML